MNTLIPPVDSVGTFTFAPPFDVLTEQAKEYRVNAVRSLLELENSGEKPFDTIYKPLSMTEASFTNDLNNNIPIVVLTSNGGEYFYVPANKILTIPKINGIKYQEKIIAVSLGNVPLDMDLTTVQDIIADDIYSVVGITTETKVVLASAVSIVDIPAHREYELLLANKKSVNKSYRTKYTEAVVVIDSMRQKITDLENYIKNN